MKKTILLICMAVIIPNILSAGEIFDIDKSNSEKLLSKNEFIICIYEEGSSKCNKFIPIFKETSKTVDNLSFGLVNIKNEIKVKGKIIAAGRSIPKVFVIKGGVIMESYVGDFTMDDFALWCKVMSFMYGKKTE